MPSYLYSQYDSFNVCYFLPNGTETNNGNIYPSETCTWWPAGVPQSTAPIAAGILSFRALGNTVNPRVLVIASLGAMGVSGVGITFHSIIQNQVGFNRLACAKARGVSLAMRHKRTGHWPRIGSNSFVHISNWADNVVKSASSEASTTSSTLIEEAKNISKLSSENNNDILVAVIKMVEFLMVNLGSIFKPEVVKGTVGDLIGQQFVIYILLMIVVLSLFLLFLSYIVNVTLLLTVVHQKEKIITKFNIIPRWIIQYYIEYQTFILKISLVYIPIFIFAGLLLLLKGLHF